MSITNESGAAPGGDERARVHVRAAAIDSTLTPGPDGRIVLSTDAAASAVAADGPDGTALFTVGAVRLGDRQALVVQAPDRRPVKLVVDTLEVAGGGRVVMEAKVELHAQRGVFGQGSSLELLGPDGAAGPAGEGGSPGRNHEGWQGRSGGPGTGGDPGGDGGPGPGGTLFFQELAGVLTVVAGGGRGGPGGAGGRG